MGENLRVEAGQVAAPLVIFPVPDSVLACVLCGLLDQGSVQGLK